MVLHSGSRGIGNQLAQAHIAKARKLAKEAMLHLEDLDLAYFVQGTPEFEAYIADMLWAQDYARANRDQMMDNAMRRGLRLPRLRQRDPADQLPPQLHPAGSPRRPPAVDHPQGRHQGRPGRPRVSSPARWAPAATSSPARATRPAGYSCSHGAGRRHSRTQAKKLFTAADLAAQMAGKVWLSKRADALVDEIPSAYKDIDQVMADQADLVEVLHTLRQVLNYKGT